MDGFSNTSIEYDPDFLNRPITNPMKAMVRKSYWNEPGRANPNVKTPVEINVGDKPLVFTQTHMADIQMLVKDEYIKKYASKDIGPF